MWIPKTMRTIFDESDEVPPFTTTLLIKPSKFAYDLIIFEF